MASTVSRFLPYTKIPSAVPARVWQYARLGALAATLGVIGFILYDPPRGLMLFWLLIVPSLPLVFAAVPGFWRQLCPMAFLNQLPVERGWSLGWTVPQHWLDHAFKIAVGLFVAAIVLKRRFMIDHAAATSIMLFAALALAAAGGLLFKGRSGWCGTFCPLGPLQKLYGHAPPVLVANGYCPTCVGCQRNCYDFNPMAAIHADLETLPEQQTEQRHLFAALLPGLILGAWLVDPFSEYGLARYLGVYAAYLLASAGLFLFAKSVLPLSHYRLTAGFGLAAFVLFYWFESAPMAGAISNFTGVLLPYPAASYVIIGAAVIVGVRVLLLGLANERAYVDERDGGLEPNIGVELDALEQGSRLAARAVIRERSSGRSIAIEADLTLLEALEKGGFAVPFGCRTGLCGADPVAIVDGQANLSQATPDELATLKRLGLAGRARLACVCRVKGPVEVDLAPGACQPGPSPRPEEPALRDLAAEAGIHRVVIIGNGVAGTTAAELLRADSASCQIDIIARESHQFYNRMALGRVMHSRTGLDGLHMMPPQWFEQRRINVWLNTLVVGIDSGASRVRLGTGQALPYDRLILAQGAEAAIPNVPGATLRGTFVLRSADDASAIRAWSQTRRCLEAVVVGGGILGVETASALQSLGLRVTILHRNNRLLDRHLDGKGAGILARFLGGTGIDVRLGVDVRAAVGGGDGHLASIELATGEQVPAQICVFCIGIKPDTGLAKAAGLAINRGVVVDPTMRTSVPAIAAIGDMAEPPGGRSGLWTEGVRQAEVAIAAMLAKPDAGTAAPSSVQLKIAGIDAQSFGRLDAGEPGDRVFVNAADGDDEHRRIVIRDGRLIGAVSVGPPGTGRQFAALAALNFDLAAVEEGIARGDWRRTEVQEIII